VDAFLLLLLRIAMFAWPASEVGLAVFRRARGAGTSRQDRGTAVLLWSVITVAVGAAVVAPMVGLGVLRWSLPVRAGAALVLLSAGIALRWWAILTLGRFFTVHVAVHDDHQLVDTGPYRVLRHPSYTGLLLSFVGLGLGFGSWVSVLVLVVPITAAVAWRIAVEERALAERLGEAHARWRERTWRLVPFVW